MLGLADFLKAVRGSATLALRRAHTMTGLALMVLLWVIALGSLFWVVQEDEPSASDDTSRAERDEEVAAGDPDDDTTVSSTRDDEGGSGTGTIDPASATGGVPLEGTTTRDVPLDAPTRTSARPGTGTETGSDGSVSSPSTGLPPSEGSAATTTTSSTRPPATTTTTAPPAHGDGGLLSGLIDLLGL